MTNLEPRAKIGLILLLALTLSACSSGPACVRSHKENRTMPMWTQFITTGKVIVPIVHPAYNYTVEVCDEYEDTTLVESDSASSKT